MTRLILGSGSPRRKEILNFFDIPFEQATSHFDEDSVEFNKDPAEYAICLSRGKARALQEKYPNDIILTADTVVYKSGKIYNKPKDVDEAFQFLTDLQGQWHSVFTAICVVKGNEEYHAWEETKVLFNALSPEEIRHYHKKVHWSDKAGGYAIQMGAGLIVNKIDGCFYNVMGLPINAMRHVLKHFDIELWDFVR
jgi:septum formation protein